MTAFSSLKVAPFRNFVSARFFLAFSIQMQNLIISWMIYNITKDPLSLGLIGIAEIIPFLSIVLFAGNMADTYSRKKMIIAANTLIIISSSVLLYTALNSDQYNDKHLLLVYYTIIIAIGFARGFFGPASQAMIPTLVPISIFANATTWNTTAFHIAAVLGPAIGGILYGWGGAKLSLLTIVAMQLVSGLLFLKLKYVQPVNEPTNDNILTRLKGGIRFVFSNQIIIGAISLDMFAVLFGGAIALLPVFAVEVYHCGAQGLGILRAAPAAGAIIMAIFMFWKPIGKNAGKILLISVAAFGVCMIAFALSTNFYLSLFILALSGAFDNISVVIRQTVVQLNTPDFMRGRVASVNSVFISLSNEIGSFESGLAAKFLGLIPSVVYGGLATIGVVGITAKVAPKLKELEM